MRVARSRFFFCHVEQAKRVETSRGSVAELWRYRIRAAQYLNNGNNPAAGKKKVFVSTRFLDYARNDRDCKNVRLTLAAEKLKHSRNIAAGEKEKRNVRLRAYSGIF